MFSSLILNDQHYNKAELIQLCQEKLIPANTPIWETKLYSFINSWLDDSAYIELKTSGSTGGGKTIYASKLAMVASAQMTGRYFQLKAGQNALLCLPVEHIAGQMMVVRALVLGLSLITVKPSGMVLETIANKQIAFAAMLPLQLYKLLFEAPCYKHKLEQINILLIGGASISAQLLAEIQTLKTAVYQSYGMTETLTHIAIRAINSSTQQPFYSLLDGVKVEQDARGCLVIDAEYLGINKLITNDLVKLHSSNKFEFLGRFDHLINTGGIKLNPEQLETKLASFIPNRRFFISSMADDKLGQKVILLIEGTAFSDRELDELQLKIRKKLIKYEQPKVIYFIQRFAETVTGKVKRQASTNLMREKTLG